MDAGVAALGAAVIAAAAAVYTGPKLATRDERRRRDRMQQHEEWASGWQKALDTANESVDDLRAAHAREVRALTARLDAVVRRLDLAEDANRRKDTRIEELVSLNSAAWAFILEQSAIMRAHQIEPPPIPANLAEAARLERRRWASGE